MNGPVCCWKCGICGQEVPAFRRRCPCQSPNHAPSSAPEPRKDT